MEAPVPTFFRRGGGASKNRRSGHMPFPLPVNHKFSCVALTNADTALNLRDPIDLGEDLIVRFEPPFVADVQ